LDDNGVKKEYDKMFIEAKKRNDTESNVIFELFSQWKDYYNPESKEFNEFYRIEEKEKLKEFDFELIGFSDKILSNLPKLKSFLKRRNG